MELQLVHLNETRHETRAAFLRGSTPEQWFREMNHWQISLQLLSGYLVPEQKGSVKPAGMLVIFEKEIPAKDRIMQPYGKLDNNLFIPVNTILTPSLTDKEARDLMIWHRQILHPGIGFIGFDEQDKVRLADLIAVPEQRVRSWEQAHPGLPPMARLTHIGVTMPPEQPLTAMLNGGEDTLPLSALPGAKPRTNVFMNILDIIAKIVLMVMAFLLHIISLITLGILRIIMSIFGIKPGVISAGAGTGRSYGKSSGSGRPFRRLGKWVSEKLENLQERRESELTRLLKMFEKDPDEALKYAIPVAQNNAGRGKAPESGSLSKRHTNFNMGTLFGSSPVDTWQAGPHYSMTLTRKYQEQAEKALKAGDYRKAAYIYAHLLGDLAKAAAVLEKGQFYHEAAALYKDHLKQPLEAARCLERGGLLSEAVKIYKSLEMFEKTGDLYRQLSQHQAADQYFRLAADQAIAKNDYPEAARLYYEKCGHPGDAQQVLLKGWREGVNDKRCLSQYLQITVETDKEKLAADIRMIYTQETPANKENDLLDILVSKRDQLEGEAEELAVNITYEVVSRQAARGDKSQLQLLKKMVPEDKELAVDIVRFNNESHQHKAQPKPGLAIRNDIQWLAATVIKQQFIFIGRKGSDVHLTRISSQGDQQHYNWSVQGLTATEELRIYLTDNRNAATNRLKIQLRTEKNALKLAPIVLPAENNFGEEVRIDTGTYHLKDFIGMMIRHDGVPAAIYSNPHKANASISYEVSSATITYFNQERYELTYENGHYAFLPSLVYPYKIYGNGPFYLHQDNSIYAFDEEGKTRIFPLEARITQMAVIRSRKGALILANTASNCFMIRDDGTSFHKKATGYNGKVLENCGFINEKFIVVADSRKAGIYEIDPDQLNMRHVKSLPLTGNPEVLFILPTGKENQVAVVDRDGFISIHTA